MTSPAIAQHNAIVTALSTEFRRPVVQVDEIRALVCIAGFGDELTRHYLQAGVDSREVTRRLQHALATKN